MTLNEQLVDLLMLAEDLRRQGGAVSAVELCRDCPELLPALEELLRGTCAVEQLLLVPAAGDPLAQRADHYPASNAADIGPQSSIPRVRGYTIREELGRGGMGV